MQPGYASYIPLFKALSDETRLQIVDMLSCGPLCACDILESFSITQPTLSYHMNLLTSCKLVKSERKGTWMTYSLNSEMFENLEAFLKLIWKDKENCICKELGTNTANSCKNPCVKE
ncbi:putative transcriptional regulator [Sphaerochaeta pleomorpha str. Grapes]|uniref:Putative transcriptional regulator n=1 Tax=Sphaerochaeta pleomorpha (strain ATCC BAA-1885 / DSM 22778 / Grapes) TaxID=158190 RepID=G8QQ79_SPHPG|nr:metalloregulator ArsR/SmtB family transcription factor [Sphaerochaeta pleomorpha]AEV28656.1 putative transcriptional regulator [Sphaerochaeta pleomorpha str. Grapes]